MCMRLSQYNWYYIPNSGRSLKCKYAASAENMPSRQGQWYNTCMPNTVHRLLRSGLHSGRIAIKRTQAAQSASTHMYGASLTLTGTAAQLAAAAAPLKIDAMLFG